MSILSNLRESKNTFEGSLPDEKTLAILHEHWFNIANRIGLLIVLGILPFVLYVFLANFLEGRDIALFYWLLTMLCLMFIWFRLFYEIMKYLMNVWIVTNHRIIDSELHGFFNRSVSEIGLSKIQDISVHINGLYETFLNFGDIVVQSAAEKDKFLLRAVPNPNAAKALIMKAASDFETFHPSQDPQP